MQGHAFSLNSANVLASIAQLKRSKSVTSTERDLPDKSCGVVNPTHKSYSYILITGLWHHFCPASVLKRSARSGLPEKKGTSARDKSAAKTTLAVSSTEFLQEIFDEG
jgi:hypothetical protein